MNLWAKMRLTKQTILDRVIAHEVGQIGKSELTSELQQNILGKVNPNRSTIRFGCKEWKCKWYSSFLQTSP